VKYVISQGSCSAAGVAVASTVSVAAVVAAGACVVVSPELVPLPELLPEHPASRQPSIAVIVKITIAFFINSFSLH
jgi:hypothetical protein